MGSGLNESLEMDEWQVLVQNASRSLINTLIIEANYKVLLRWYMVPVRLTSYVPGASPHCFRGCGQEGKAFHTWWQCPMVRHYRILVSFFIYSLAQVNLQKSLKQALLGSLVENAQRYSKLLITLLVCGSKDCDR